MYGQTSSIHLPELNLPRFASVLLMIMYARAMLVLLFVIVFAFHHDVFHIIDSTFCFTPVIITEGRPPRHKQRLLL